MNKKGFTLVEVLAVIVLLSIVMTLVATKGFGAFDSAKEKINEQTIKEIKEGVNVFLTDVEFCDETLNDNIFEKLDIKDNNANSFKCDELQEKASSSDCIQITLNELKELKYVNSSGVSSIENDESFEIKACLKDGKKTITLVE